MVLAVAELEQSVFRHAPVNRWRWYYQAHAGRLQVIDAQRVLIQGPSKAFQRVSSLKASSTVAIGRR